MSLQFTNPKCGHMGTDDAPCRCRVPYPNAVDIAIDSDDLEDMQRRNAASVGLPLDKYLRLSDDAPCNCLKPGWLSRQAEQVAINSATWPQWMRSQSQDSNLSPEQRAKAARILRDRADELSPCNCHVRQGGQVADSLAWMDKVGHTNERTRHEKEWIAVMRKRFSDAGGSGTGDYCMWLEERLYGLAGGTDVNPR